MALKYFLYSEEQVDEKNKILAKSSRKFSPGVIVINNRREYFSQISDSPTIPRFVDTKVIASGDPKDFTYKMPENIPLRGE